MIRDHLNSEAQGAPERGFAGATSVVCAEEGVDALNQLRE
jgi:hypothetical protein